MTIDNHDRAGNFAVCYKAAFPGTRKYACIRLFSRKSEERRGRYEKISTYLKAHPLDCLVGFEYIESGIRHPSPDTYGGKQWYPIIRMDWVDGQILYDWLRDRCQQRNSHAISELAERWIEVAEQLSREGIAHGDLQHGNVMVTSTGQVKLVDYDCMFVPSLVGSVNLEMGVEPYQHRERDERTMLFPGLDHFSQLFILVVLKALAADPGLWFRYIEPPSSHEKPYDKLLIRRSDFDNAQTSSLYTDLLQSKDPDVGRLAKALFSHWHGAIDAVPALSSFMFNFDDVKVHFQRKAWDEGLELLANCGNMKVPQELVPSIEHARKCVEARLELERALQTDDEPRIQKAGTSSHLQGYSRSLNSVQKSHLAPLVISILAKLEELRQKQNWRQFVSQWDANTAILSNRQSARKYERDIEAWRQRNRLCDRIRELIAARPIDSRALKTKCQELRRLGGHPEIDAEIPEFELLVQRTELFRAFQTVPRLPGEANDLALISAWNESLFSGWPDAEAERPRLNSAKGRLVHVETLRRAVSAAISSKSLDREKAIRSASEAIATGYEIDSSLLTRVLRSVACLDAIECIDQSLTQPVPKEKVLAQCWKVLNDHESISLISSGTCSRLEVAARRVPLLDKLSSISPQGPINRVDAAILSVWNASLLENCPEAAPWKQRVGEAKRRSELLLSLDVALAAADDSTAESILNNPLLAAYPFEKSLSARVEIFRKKIEKVQSLITALRNHRTEEFIRGFDHRLVKASQAIFAPYQAQITELLQRELLPIKNVGLKKPSVESALTQESRDRYQVRWNWPPPHISGQCLLGICRRVPQNPNDTELAIHRIPIDRQRWDAGLGAFPITVKQDWRTRNALTVAVWAVIDLGFQTYYSEPLILGRMADDSSFAG